MEEGGHGVDAGCILRLRRPASIAPKGRRSPVFRGRFRILGRDAAANDSRRQAEPDDRCGPSPLDSRGWRRTRAVVGAPRPEPESEAPPAANPEAALDRPLAEALAIVEEHDLQPSGRPELVERALRALLKELDPYSRYLNAQAATPADGSRRVRRHPVPGYLSRERPPLRRVFDSELEWPVEVLIRPALAVSANPGVGPAGQERKVLRERQGVGVTKKVERTAVFRGHRQRELQQFRRGRVLGGSPRAHSEQDSPKRSMDPPSP